MGFRAEPESVGEMGDPHRPGEPATQLGAHVDAVRGHGMSGTRTRSASDWYAVTLNFRTL
jgi:hypothetical protein